MYDALAAIRTLVIQCVDFLCREELTRGSEFFGLKVARLRNIANGEITAVLQRLKCNGFLQRDGIRNRERIVRTFYGAFESDGNASAPEH